MSLFKNVINIVTVFISENLERIVEIAKLRAMQKKARFAKLKICVYKEEMPITPYERPLFNSLRFERSDSEAKLFEHHCEVDVSFGPWEAVADVYDLLHCIVSDLAERGITAEQQCIGVCDKHLINHYYCKRPIYEFKITWWWSWREEVVDQKAKGWMFDFYDKSADIGFCIEVANILCWCLKMWPFKSSSSCFFQKYINYFFHHNEKHKKINLIPTFSSDIQASEKHFYLELNIATGVQNGFRDLWLK